MSIHPSLNTPEKDKLHRSVLKRSERLKIMAEKGTWKEGDRVYGLPKIKTLKIKIKKEKVEKPEEAVAAEGAVTAAATETEGKTAGSKPAAATKPAAKEAQPKASAKEKKVIVVFLSRLNRAIFAIAAFILLFAGILYAQELFPFQGILKEDGINIRSDSTVNARIICNAKKGQELFVTGESYGWYKIRLPIDTPSYINREAAVCVDEFCSDAKVLQDRVRIRLEPDKDSFVLGVAKKDELVHVLEKSGDWYKIQPVENNYGWIHKSFVEKAPLAAASPVTEPAEIETLSVQTPAAAEIPAEQTAAVQETQAQPQAGEQDEITITGTVAPYGKVFRRKATHKLISQSKETFLLKGDKKELDSFNYRKAKVVGTTLDLPGDKKLPVIEVISIEEIK